MAHLGRRPLTFLFVLSVLILGLAFYRIEVIARQSTENACEAFQESKALLRNVLILAISTDRPAPEGATEEELEAFRDENQRRIAFRDQLLSEIDRAEC